MATSENVFASIVSAARAEAAAAESLAERLHGDPRLQSILTKGIVTFGDAQRFRNWLRLPSQALSTSPLNCLLNGDMQAVEDELIRIRYGIF